MENESFSADIHDAFCSFMLRCSSFFHPSKSLRNKNEAKLLRYFLFLSFVFHQTEGFALTHIGWDVTLSHRLRCSVSYNATLTQNNNNPQVWVSRARTDLKRKHNYKGISHHSCYTDLQVITSTEMNQTPSDHSVQTQQKALDLFLSL